MTAAGPLSTLPVMRERVMGLVRGEGGGVVTTADLERIGVGPAVLRTLQRDGVLTRVARGVYADAARLDPPAEEVARRGRADVAKEAHLLRLDAVLRSYGAAVGASHQSAALAWGLPVLVAHLGRVHLARTRPGGTGRRHEAFTIHRCEHEDAFTELGGRTLVVPALAVLGTALQGGLEAGVVTADGALRDGRTTLAELVEWLERLRHHPGLSTARKVVSLADGSVESPGESLLRLILIALGIAFETQHWIRVADGSYYRVDFYLPELGVVLEFDGLTKYGVGPRRDEASPGWSAGPRAAEKDPLVAEKVREDAIRALGFGVGRVVWSGLKEPVVRATVMAVAPQASDRARNDVSTPPPWITQEGQVHDEWW
ncbi:MAG: hypothetical protein DCC50_01920 [Acidobacteria bacterium]|nr:MAG: hypothetical protein DCC50_01920 [Acidobacteriota bacterium]